MGVLTAKTTRDNHRQEGRWTFNGNNLDVRKWKVFKLVKSVDELDND